MTALGNFGDLANIQANTVERPKPLPAGHYIAQFTGPMKPHKATKSGNQAMRFSFKLIGAGDDVNADELEAAGGLPDKEFNLDFWMSPEARYRFTDFACGAMGLSDSMNLLELAEALIAENKPFSIQNKPETGEQTDPKVPPPVYNRWDNPSSAE